MDQVSWTQQPPPPVPGTALVVWGLISTAFFAYLYVALIAAVRASLPTMGAEAATSLRNATIVLLSSFGIYPLVYAVPVFADVTPAWFAAMQVGYSVADVVAKVGFGVLVHKVAKLRTAEDVAAEVDMNVVCTGDGDFVEVQGTGEANVFRRDQLDALLDLGVLGCAELAAAQQKALAS